MFFNSFKHTTHCLIVYYGYGVKIRATFKQFLHRMVQFADTIGKPLQLLYYPPYHSKYNPIERCWGILELHWNGTQLIDVDTMLEWAKSMTWKGLQPIVALSHKVYQKGIALCKKAMRAVEGRLKRHPELTKW